jgi:hypothetical protein
MGLNGNVVHPLLNVHPSKQKKLVYQILVTVVVHVVGLVNAYLSLFITNYKKCLQLEIQDIMI